MKGEEKKSFGERGDCDDDIVQNAMVSLTCKKCGVRLTRTREEVVRCLGKIKGETESM